jgi:copper homeostasis protein
LKKLEIACFNYESAVIAESYGADRLELCENYKQGGITPDHQLILKVRKNISTQLHVMIRPRGGNYIYTSEEYKVILRDIEFCKISNIPGIVIGILNSNNEINIKMMKEVVSLAYPMHVTFHRAFDLCKNKTDSLIQLMQLGINSLLTSGGNGNAIDNISILSSLNELAENRIEIIPAGNIRASNVSLLLQSGCKYYHSSVITGNKIMADPEELTRLKKIISEY